MSAAAQFPRRVLWRSEMDDWEILLDVSGLANAASNAGSLVSSLADRLLDVIGIHRIVLEPAPSSTWLGLDWGILPAGPQGSAVAPITAGGKTWGTVRMYFSPFDIPVWSPVRFTTFIGQQLAGALTRIELQAGRSVRLQAIAALERRLKRRKLATRAAGKMAELGHISHTDALIHLIAQARRQRRSLLEVSITVLAFIEAREYADSSF